MLKGKEFGEAIALAIQLKLESGSAKTKAEIARHFGMKPPSLADWVKKGSVSKDKLPELWRYFSDVAGPEHWGMTESEWPIGLVSDRDATESASTSTSTQHNSNAEPGPRLGSTVKVPVVGSAQLGDNGFRAELEYPVGHGDGFVEFAARDANAYALRCVGDSMKPRIKDGEFVVVYPNHTPGPGDEVLVRFTDGRVMVKEMLYIRDNVLHLLSINEAHGKVTAPLSEVEKIHYVAAIAKKATWAPE